MAKVPFSTDAVARLKGQYGWVGGRYRNLIGKIIAANNEKAARAVGRVRVADLRAQAEGFGSRWKRAVLPILEEVLPKQSVFIRKGAERGKLLTDALRERLSQDLRDTLTEFGPGMVIPKGKLRGRIDPDLAEAFREKIEATFAGWTERDPEIGIPPNIRTIAVTETRAIVNEVKQRYFERLEQKNPGLEVKKRWKHNPHLSQKDPRPGHAATDGKEAKLSETFAVPLYEHKQGKWRRTGQMLHILYPHDPRAPPEETINCHCDLDYFARALPLTAPPRR